jgi:hypothetical protein
VPLADAAVLGRLAAARHIRHVERQRAMEDVQIDAGQLDAGDDRIQANLAVTGT